MPNEPPMPGDWAAKMIPTLTEVVGEAGDVQELPAHLELGEAPSLEAADGEEEFLKSLGPQLHAQVAQAVSAALREQWGALQLRVQTAVDQAVRTTIAHALERREKP